jgi:WD40 repeat protein
LKLAKAGTVFLGSKDSNIYQIDIVKGKLCIVYEGHWSRIHLTYLVPQRDILVTVAESNCKVWDLQYDECIKNMNEHTTIVIFCRVHHENPKNMVTISQNYEYKVWNFTTGNVVEAKKLLLEQDL